MPPRKKYQTMYHSHCGGATKCWGMTLLLPAALAEREDRADDAEGGRDQVAELDRLGRARLGAGGHQVGLQAVVAERALAGQTTRLVEADHVVRAGRDAVAAAVAHARLDVDGVELRPDDRVGRTDFHAARHRAVFANV